MIWVPYLQKKMIKMICLYVFVVVPTRKNDWKNSYVCF